MFCMNSALEWRHKQTAATDICILQSTSSGFLIMSNLLNIHDFGLSGALGGHKLPRVTYVLFSPNLLLPARGADREEKAVTVRE